jgi:predicted small secreted protein
MKTRALAVSLVALSLLAAGCAGLTRAGSGDIDHPTGPADLVLQMDLGGGFVAPAYELRRIPTWSLFGDGRMITEGPQIEIYPGPALPSIQVQIISEDGIQAILEAATAAGLLGPDRAYGQGCVADAPTTTFTVYADGTKHVVSAYALGMVPGSCPGEDTEARAALARFSAKLSGLAGWLPTGSLGQQDQFEFSEMRVYVQPYAGSPEPGLHQTAIRWPLSVPLPSFGDTDGTDGDVPCGIVGGADLAKLLPDAQRANELTPWRSDGADYSLIFRPLLPDEHDC